MTDVSELEDAVEIMMNNNEIKDCLDYIEKIDQDIVFDNTYLFESKLNCLYELNRKMDAFKEAKAYRADFRPLAPVVCAVLGNGYNNEGNHIEAYFYFSQFHFDEKHDTLSRLVKEIEKEVKMKLDEERFEECMNFIDTMSQDVVASSEVIFDCKIKCLIELNQKKEALKTAKAHLDFGGVLSHHSYEMLGSCCALMEKYDEARQHFRNAMKTCLTQEEKLRFRNLLKNMEKEEETRKLRKEDKRVAKIDPSFLKGRTDKGFTKSTKKKVNQNRKEIGKKKEASQLQCAEDLKGDSSKEEEVEAIIVKFNEDLCGESNKKKDIEKAKEPSVTNLEFPATVKFSVVDFHYDMFDVLKEDHFDKYPMSLVKATVKHLENLSLLKSWGYDLPYMARVESALPSNFMSSDPLLVVERIQPLHVFFTLEREEFMKKNSSCASKERGWWEFIRERFRMIYRDIMCGLFFLHSSNRVCSDFHDSFYVSKEGRGKILHNFSKEFSFAAAQQDVNDLVMQIEFVITGSNCHLIGSKDWKCHIKKIKDSYDLPEELEHFLISLNTHYGSIALGRLPSTWLIDPPYFWDDRHRISFIKVLKDLVREGCIPETAFDDLRLRGLLHSWSEQINNNLLLAIHNYKSYSYQTRTSMLFYLNAVYSHINDQRYSRFRSAKFEDGEVELLLRGTFPEVYTHFFEGLCLLSESEEIPMRYAEILKRLSSCCTVKYDRTCLKQ